LRRLLIPLSFLYGFISFIRNRCYDWGIIKSSKPVIPAIVVGNLSMGGSGKTPFSEYLIRHFLSLDIKVSFLSRGYGRKSKGFLIYKKDAVNATQIGDEPMQIALKFRNIPVAVCENRLKGIEQIANLHKGCQLVILDDAYQHRSVKPDFSILIFDYTRLHLPLLPFPTGNQREFLCEKNRADILIINKCPVKLKDAEKQVLIDRIKPLPQQKIYFTTIEYGDIKSVFSNEKLRDTNSKMDCIVFCGIANPTPFLSFCDENFNVLDKIIFNDHHTYIPEDIQSIRKRFINTKSNHCILLCTEKDRVKLISKEFKILFHQLPVYFIEIKIRFLERENEFHQDLQRTLQNIDK
jgi:tetraacyldisaccharide 4'-kinase